MASFTETDEVGVYTVGTARGETRVAVNLMNAEESNLAPRPLPAFVEGARRGGAAGPHPARAVAVLRRCSPWSCSRSKGLLYWRRQSGGPVRAARRALGDRWALGLRCALMAVLVLALLRADACRGGSTG